MIIDISYIKKVLETDTDDTQMQHLIHHVFDDICEKVNVDTTLVQQDISDIVMSDNIEEVNLVNDELTAFQDALIYGIGCNLNMMGISVAPVTLELYNEVINKIDTSNIPLKSDGMFDITFCDIYTGCVRELNEFLNDKTDVGYLRRLLNLHKDDIGDKEIEFLIDHYTQYLTDIIPDVDPQSPYFKQAVYLSVACHIYRTNPTSIIDPTEYRVDEVSEVFGLNFDKFGNTWCDLADAAISDLKKVSYGNYGIKTFDRPGARTKYNAWGPTGNR